MRPTLPIALLLTACASPDAPPADAAALEESPMTTPAATVRALYDLVTFDAGATPDWDAVRALFLEEAVVVLRTGPEELTVFSREGFVADFVAFAAQEEVARRGFAERILDLREIAYGDVAQVLVRFESDVPGDGRAPNEGLDSFELIRRDGAWRIVSVVNERPRADEAGPIASLFG